MTSLKNKLPEVIFLDWKLSRPPTNIYISRTGE